MDTTYWAAQRGRLSANLIAFFKAQYPSLPAGANIFIKNDPNYPFVAVDWGGTSKQASLILSNSDALQLLYKDPSLTVYYEDLGGLPANLKGKNVFQFTAKIN